ncbi:type II secretion system F family protein [Marinibaculum pumilum]|uniref:Type II secretion system F family protein n=1 Tax=Marinibaculum pumilum TaxID=1766165 RepID=A0ABV7L0T4_9PROT
MARFEYRALAANGEIVTGEIEGPDRKTVLDRLHDQALLPIQAMERDAGSGKGLGLQLSLGDDKAFPPGELALFAQQLTRLLNARLPLDRALEILVDLMEKKKSKKIVAKLLDRVRDGAGLADAMAAEPGVFPGLCISMVRAGEESGALPVVLARVADFLGKSEAIRQRITSAMIYPTILTVAATAAVVLILTLVMPQFESLFANAGADLPTATVIVMAASDGLRGYWWAILAGIGGLAAVLQLLSRQDWFVVFRDRSVLRLPLLGPLITRIEVARFSRSLGTLLGNGVPAARALALAGATVTNRTLVDAIEALAIRFKSGEGLARSLEQTGHFPDLAIRLIQIGEETARLQEMLQELAGMYEHDVERILERLLALLVPAITLAMGALVAMIMGAVMTALVSINQLGT